MRRTRDPAVEHKPTASDHNRHAADVVAADHLTTDHLITDRAGVPCATYWPPRWQPRGIAPTAVCGRFDRCRRPVLFDHRPADAWLHGMDSALHRLPVGRVRHVRRRLHCLRNGHVCRGPGHLRRRRYPAVHSGRVFSRRPSLPSRHWLWPRQPVCVDQHRGRAPGRRPRREQRGLGRHKQHRHYHH